MGGPAMANPEHLKILKQGVDVWNRWRKENPSIQPQLTNARLQDLQLDRINFENCVLNGAFFCKSTLIGANLSEAYLMGTIFGTTSEYSESTLTIPLPADLTNANLSLAKLHQANFCNSILSYSNLRGAGLVRANFSGANLEGVDLSRSSLLFANLSDSMLTGTNFSNAELGWTKFGNVDLSLTTGLAEAKHTAPSTIGIDTVFQSSGKIPESFLRGCGVTESFIQYVSSLTSEAFEFYSCFISYSSKDQAFAERLYSDLQNIGVRCWFAPEDMKIGDKIRDRIDQSIRLHDKLLLILSEHSINSDWVEDEVEAAYEQERIRGKIVLFPIGLDTAVMDTDKAWAAKLRRSRHIGDFTKWKNHDSYQKVFDRLLKDLKAEKPQTD
jgi:hypothetical protein